MASLNKVMVIGNLGRDPEVSYTPGGAGITKFSVASKEVWNDKNTGEKKEKTEWHRIVAFGKLGETCAKYLSKGKQVYIEGKLQTSSYEKDGITRYSTDIIASAMQFLGGRAEGQQSQGQQQGYSGGYQQQPQQGNMNQGQHQGYGGGYQQQLPQQHQGAQPQGFNQPPPDDDIPF